ncbi:MAG: hypothetical protein ACYC8T_04250 [Myxococcaceae bacterium]
MHLIFLLMSISVGAADGGSLDAGAVAPAEDAGAPVAAQAAPQPSTVHVRCPKTCIIYVDGLRQMKMTSDKKAVLMEKVPPGSHQVVGKDTLNAIIGSGVVEVPPASEVFVQIGSGKATVTVAKPLH